MTDGQIKEDVFKDRPAKKIESAKITTAKKSKESSGPQKGLKAIVVKKEKKLSTSPTTRAGSKKGGKAKKIKSTKSMKPNKKGQRRVSFIPVFEVPEPVGHSLSLPVLEQKMDIIKTGSKDYSEPTKKTIRRSGLEIKKAEELQEKKRLAQEKEWEIPAFLRKVKFKS